MTEPRFIDTLFVYADTRAEITRLLAEVEHPAGVALLHRILVRIRL